MTMISGPFTDEIVKMLRTSGQEAPARGDVLLAADMRWGVFDGSLVYVSGETVAAIAYADFAGDGVRVVPFPEPYGDGFRLVDSGGGTWIPEFSPAERSFLKECGYRVNTAAETVAMIRAALGQKQHPFYAISCKTAVMPRADAEKIAICLKKVM